jgi:hypothetical protein
LCEFFRHGQCTKGFKCKYSHDLSVERKGPKIDLFTDQRDAQAQEAEEVSMLQVWVPSHQVADIRVQVKVTEPCNTHYGDVLRFFFKPL